MLEIPRGLKIGAGLVVLLAGYIFNLTTPIQIKEYSLATPPTLEPNTVLRKSQQLLRGRLDGPECLAFQGKFIYTGLADGRIVRIDTEFNQVDTLMFTGQPQRALPFPCGEYNTEHICGRPLGMQFDAKGRLIVADAYFGLLAINVTTTKSTSLTKRPDDKKRKSYSFPNSVAVSQKKNGAIYFTDSSRFQRRDVALEVLERLGTGRLLKYNPRSKKTETVLEGLFFPNGLLLAADESFLLMAELTKARILKYYLTGDKKGKQEVWADNLPVLPDNLSWDEDEDGEATGALWVAGTKRTTGIASFDSLGGMPAARQLIAKTMKPADLLDWAPTEGVALRLNADGKVVDAPQDSTSRISSLSGAYAHGDSLYLGSYKREFKFLAKIPRADLSLQPL